MRNEASLYQTLYSTIIVALVLSSAAWPVIATETTATSSIPGSNPMAVLDGDVSTSWVSNPADTIRSSAADAVEDDSPYVPGIVRSASQTGSVSGEEKAPKATGSVSGSEKKTGSQEITVDLGHSWPVRSIEIQWGADYPSEYEVQLTADGKTWQTVAHPVGFKMPKGDPSRFKFAVHKIEPAAESRGLRIRCLEFTNGFEMVDLRVNGFYPFCFEPVPADAVCRNKTADPETRVRDMLSRMTIREKIGMTAGMGYFFEAGDGGRIAGIERFGFPTVIDTGTSTGVNRRPDVEKERSAFFRSTEFPLGSALAATWQPELAFLMGKSIGEECRAAGSSILNGPGINIFRTSTCGRNFEYMGEDPYLASRMVVEHIKGVQSQKVVTALRHFVANNNEFVRWTCNVIVDERTLHEIYLPAFAAAVKEANVRAIMSAYNWLNGEQCGENKTLLTDILRGELGYTGMVMTDWGLVGAPDMTKILGSGQNLLMPSTKAFWAHLRSQLEKDPAGTEKLIDEMITPTIRVLFEMGIWDRDVIAPEFNKTIPGHKAVARTIAESGITLLKNDQVLPLTPGQNILITGSANGVTNSHSGGGSGSSRGYDHINFYEGLKGVFGDSVTYELRPSDAAIKKADRILYFFKMGDQESADRPFELPETMTRQIQALADKNPSVIVVASTGTGFNAPWLDSVKGLVHGYFLGQEYGAAMAAVLSGKVNPSGKLPFTMEKSFEDSPAYGYNLIEGKPWWSSALPPKYKSKFGKPFFDVHYSEGVFVGYRWYEAKKKPVNFPFGFGLSYTTFEISDVKVSAKTITKEKPMTVSVTVKNTGKVAGAEVAQLYVHDEEASVERPYRELKGFQKVFLQPGESKTVTMTLDWKALAFWDVKTHAWKTEPGAFTLLVGNSSQNVQCQARINYK